LVAHAGDGVLDSLDVGLLHDMLHLCGVRHVLLTLLRVAHGLAALVAQLLRGLREGDTKTRDIKYYSIL
jgi:hypothetical protein